MGSNIYELVLVVFTLFCSINYVKCGIKSNLGSNRNWGVKRDGRCKFVLIQNRDSEI